MSSSFPQTNNEGMAAEHKQTGTPSARILLVDDDPVNQMVALGLLRRHGWEAVAASNGEEALRILSKQRFDLILMDLQMPVMDGPEATRRIRQIAPDAHILVLTTYATDEFIFKALRAGAQGY
ncbi:MAG: hybrid sensor histidine kinase/response regulator, partial [Verrucomicrobia bacterium]